MDVKAVNLIAGPGNLEGISLTPELLASVGARYSRSDEGLEEIVKKIEGMDPDKAVDAIFKHVDYGHASIGDMVPVAMFMDGISILLACFLWYVSPTASGQESSTRYIKMKPERMLSGAESGIGDHLGESQYVAMGAYHEALDWWTKLGEDQPERMGISKEVMEDQSDKGKLLLERLRRNYAFDRARVFLPLSAKTNMMMIMGARSWVETIGLLLAHPLKEFQTLGLSLRDQLMMVAPRMAKHAVVKRSNVELFEQEIGQIAQRAGQPMIEETGKFLPMLEIRDYNLARIGLRDQHMWPRNPRNPRNTAFDSKWEYVERENRYSRFNVSGRMMQVDFGWKNASIGEIRDLNRHRTGEKYISWMPTGFYNAFDQLDYDSDPAPTGQLPRRTEEQREIAKGLRRLSLDMLDSYERCWELLSQKRWEGLYFLSLGHTMEFRHVTSYSKWVYEVELRTGKGAHYRYAAMMRETMKLAEAYYEPEVWNKIQVGMAEPE